LSLKNNQEKKIINFKNLFLHLLTSKAFGTEIHSLAGPGAKKKKKKKKKERKKEELKILYHSNENIRYLKYRQRISWPDN
jgi:hypothetical protein